MTSHGQSPAKSEPRRNKNHVFREVGPIKTKMCNLVNHLNFHLPGKHTQKNKNCFFLPVKLMFSCGFKLQTLDFIVFQLSVPAFLEKKGFCQDRMTV